MKDYEIILSQGKWTKIFSCYKDILLNGGWAIHDQTLEFNIYASSTVKSPCILSTKFQFNCLQIYDNNVNTKLFKVEDNDYFDCCYNVVTDKNNKKVVEVYVKTDENFDFVFLNITKCPNINLFKFYNYVMPVDVVENKTDAVLLSKIKKDYVKYQDTDLNVGYQFYFLKSGNVVTFKCDSISPEKTGYTTIPSGIIQSNFLPSTTLTFQRCYSENTSQQLEVRFLEDGRVVIHNTRNTSFSVSGTFITIN